MSLVHVCLQCREWQNIGYVAFDEVHSAGPLMLLLMEYLLQLKRTKDARVAGLKIFFITATPETAIVDKVKARLLVDDITLGNVELTPQARTLS